MVAEPIEKADLILSLKNVKQADLSELKRAALQQEVEGSFDAALELWNRINIASQGRDSEFYIAFRRIEGKRLGAEKRAKERLAAEQREKQRLEAEQREKQRMEAEQREKQRLEAEQREKQRLEAEQREKERLEAEQEAKRRLEDEERQKRLLEAERRLNERLEAEQREKKRLAAEREKQRLEAEQREKERLAAEQREKVQQFFGSTVSAWQKHSANVIALTVLAVTFILLASVLIRGCGASY